MPAHTFHALSDADFEELACDLLGAALRTHFQIFTPGRDSGIDLLQGTRIAKATIVQCKHYWRSGYAKLKSVIQKTELPKIKKLNPKRYILATSVGLTPKNKQELQLILAPYCKGINDIYGLDDINRLLREHPAIEEAHYKIWLTSSAVLQRVLRHGSAVWNSIEKSEILRKMSLYVQSPAYTDVLDILSKHNYCIVSGIPGIGKTTLAQIIVTRLLEDNFELLAVREDIKEAFELLDLNRRQIVYYDDFLGRSSIGDRLGKNEDQGILRLLSEAKRSKNTKVLFTTREYILADACRMYERLSGPELEIAKCIIKLEQYTRGNLARILYNHIYYSDLPRTHVRALLCDQSYRKIIDHDNYSPRIIEWMTGNTAIAGVPAANYSQTFLAALDNPTHIWKHAYDNQLSDDSRSILLCISTVSGSIGHDDLREVWGALLVPGKVSRATLAERQRFANALKQLDGSFIRTRRSHAEIIIDFHNPSIRDFISRRIGNDIPLVIDLMEAALYYEQISHLLRLNHDGKCELKPSGILSDGPVLRSAIVRTIGNRSPLFHVVRNINREEWLERDSANIGQRLSEAAKWCADLSGKTFLRFLCETARDLLSTEHLGKIATIDACEFVSAIVVSWPPKGGPWSELVTTILEGIGNELYDAPSSQDWVKWTNFIESHDHLYDEKEDTNWQEQAELFCESEIDTILHNADNASDAEAWFEDIREIARYWDIDILGYEERLQDWISEHSPQDEGGEEWDGERYSSHGRRAEGETEDEINHLFQSLDDEDE